MPLFDDIRDLVEQFRQNAEEVDQSYQVPRAQLEALANTGYFEFATRAESGQRRRLLDLLSSGCGATSFLATQHVGACRRLAKTNHPLLEQAMPGRVWIGVCFAHLRRPRSPVTIEIDSEDLVFNGRGPWFSGLGMMRRMLVGGATSDGQFFMAQCEVEQPAIKIGECQPLAVMNATATVPLEFQGLRIPKSEVVVEFDRELMTEADMHSTVYQSARSLGVARAAAGYLPETGRQQLVARIEGQHQKMDQWDSTPDWPSATALRVQAIQLAGLAVQAAFTSVGGRSHSLNHPVQRLAREASFYSTTQLTAQLKEATLKQF